MNNSLINKYKGMLWGLVVGDCLGSPIQFTGKDDHPYISKMEPAVSIYGRDLDHQFVAVFVKFGFQLYHQFHITMPICTAQYPDDDFVFLGS